ncbi:hypothetical protein E5288_WYG008446 [Bos mutus]|uniref:Uncharacterized protein n=1 Tax=Bos mutus TaxID=72004 RepID=A0A6B0RWS6_9CETA|nr:hypothetical protein [Bos mutus]
MGSRTPEGSGSGRPPLPPAQSPGRQGQMNGQASIPRQPQRGDSGPEQDGQRCVHGPTCKAACSPLTHFQCVKKRPRQQKAHLGSNQPWSQWRMRKGHQYAALPRLSSTADSARMARVPGIRRYCQGAMVSD